MHFVMYLKPHTCGYSKNAMALLRQRGHTFEGHDVDTLGGTMAVVNKLKSTKMLAQNSTHRTVPIIFHNGTFVGGYTELCAYLKCK